MTAVNAEYLAFCVGAEEYGINILDVQEIRQYEAPTRIANAPAHTLGVVNLRGVIVPITDLGQVLLQRPPPITDQTVTVFCTKGQSLQGLVVDSVNDVIAPTEEDRKGAPAFTAAELASRPVVEEIACMEGKRNVMLTSVSALLHSHQADR